MRIVGGSAAVIRNGERTVEVVLINEFQTFRTSRNRCRDAFVPMLSSCVIELKFKEIAVPGHLIFRKNPDIHRTMRKHVRIERKTVMPVTRCLYSLWGEVDIMSERIFIRLCRLTPKQSFEIRHTRCRELHSHLAINVRAKFWRQDVDVLNPFAVTLGSLSVVEVGVKHLCLRHDSRGEKKNRCGYPFHICHQFYYSMESGISNEGGQDSGALAQALFGRCPMTSLSVPPLMTSS